jgi:hypothetical protein
LLPIIKLNFNSPNVVEKLFTTKISAFMKRKFVLPRGIAMLTGALIISGLMFTSCNKDDDNDNNDMFNLSGSANGSQVVPSVAGSGTGTITGTYNRNTNQLNYNIGWNGLSGAASSVGFYGGAMSGANGTQVGNNLSITTAGSTGGSIGTITLNDQQESDLMAGKWYYLIGTPTNGTGEVRGQITTTAQ